MSKKQFTQVVIVREDLLSKSEFSRQYKIDRKTLDKLIVERLLNTEVICGVAFINIADSVVIENALQYRQRNPRSWSHSSYSPKAKKHKTETPDEKLDREFEEYERTH